MISVLRLATGCVLAGATLAACSLSFAQEDRGLETARQHFEKEQRRNEKTLSAAFEKVLNRLNGSQGKAESRLPVIDVVKAEQERFEKSKLVPWSAPMRSYTQAYLKSLWAAQSKLAKAYDSGISKNLKQKNDGNVESLRADYKSVVAPTVIACWKHQAGESEEHYVELFSNGHINNPESPHLWSLSGNSLILKWKNPKAPGGAFIDNCTIAEDGRTYSGTNQSQLKVSARYVVKP